jgi:hypothetical protein
MVIRRGIAVLAVALALLLGWLVHGRMSASTKARGESFFENAVAIRGAYQKALGPHPPVVELVIEPELCTAQVVVGSDATQTFTLGQSSGYVVAGPEGPFPERDDTAFSMSSVPFSDMPALVASAEVELGAAPARLVIDRLPSAKQLRVRAVSDDGREALLRTPDR